jgi:lysophospholipase L1-like esterase
LNRLRSLLASLALVTTSLVVCLLVIEGGLRLFWTGYYLKNPGGYARPSATLGWENKPSVTVDYGEPEFSTLVRHNAFGFRSPEIPLEKPDGVCRVLVLGDSFTYGVGVENEETFVARIEELDPRLQVINAGVNGYGTAQELLTLTEKGLEFEPDLVIVAFFWNDVANSYKRQVARFRLEDGALIYPEPAPVDVSAGPRKIRRRYLRHSYAYRFLSDGLKTIRRNMKVALGIPIEDGDLLRPEEEEPAWELEYALLREIDRVSAENGAKTLLLLVPEQVQVQRDARVSGLRAEDYEVQDRLVAFGREAGIPVLDPRPTLVAAYEKDGVPLYYRWDRHFRANGHRLVAAAILDEIRRLDLIPCSPGSPRSSE